MVRGFKRHVQIYNFCILLGFFFVKNLKPKEFNILPKEMQPVITARGGNPDDAIVKFFADSNGFAA